MPDRERWSGRLAYLGANGQRTGREIFSVSVHGDGSRTLRAQCEMDDDDLVRDAHLVLGPDARPCEAYVRLVEQGAWTGSGWYRAGPGGLTAHTASPAGPGETSLAGDLAYFGTHALINDGWLALALGDRSEGVIDGAACSHRANGGGAPALLTSRAVVRRLPDETLTVAGGRFACRHIAISYGDYPPIDAWVTGPHALLVLMTWTHLAGRYELEHLARD